MIEKKHDLCYLKLLKNKLLLLLVGTLLILSCNRQDNLIVNSKTTLTNFFKTNNIPHNDKTSLILVLSEEGCLNCDKSFSNLLQKFINNPNALILITASGTRIDISSFQHDSIKNVFFDDRNEFSKLNLIEHSGAIFLNKNQIDTIVSIEASEIEKQFQFINDNISK